jgi:hypothetical protein
MIIEIQVHSCGTVVLIDREAGTIGTRYPKEPKPREIYSLADEWVKPFTVCRFCGKEVDDTRLAFAYWKLQQDVCGADCFRSEQLKRYACCEKATQHGCVCAYSTICPDHGERHFGTHD